MNEAFLLLANAIQEYNSGQLETARRHAKKAADLLKHIIKTAVSPQAAPIEHSPQFSYLNALTLLQSIASRQHNLTAYESYEAAVRDCMKAVWGDFSESYYAVHLLDACECYLNAGDIANAQWRLEMAVSILENENGSCPLFDFLHAAYHAKLHFYQNQYYDCIARCIDANSFWMEKALIPDNATAFLQTYAANEALITNLACTNFIFLACAYGKINNPEEGLAILTELAKEPPEDYYLHTSLDLNLAELYTRAGMLDEARSIYQEYRNRNLAQYPDLSVTLATLSILLEPQSTPQSTALFAAEYDGQLPASTCYSKDAFQIILYNCGLGLIQKEQYTQALTIYEQLGDKGLSLKIYLLAQTGNFTAIPHCKKAADRYFDCEIRSLFLYYNEKLVYNHLSLLEYHFSLCMDSYISCYEALGRQSMPPEGIYDFLLNTKGISLEAAYLSRHYQTLEALNSRKPLTSPEIQECLSHNEILLDYCITRTVTESYYCVFLITQEQIHCIRLANQQTIDELVSQWHLFMQQAAYAAPGEQNSLKRELRETDTRLRRLLYRPIKDFLGSADARHFIISPAGALIQFPFCRLPMNASTYLGDCYEITYLNTAKELLTNAPSKNNHFNSALVIGNPALTNYAPLPYAEQEAQQTAEYLNTNCYIGENARLSLFGQCLDKAPSLVHIATHGVFFQSPQHNVFNSEVSNYEAGESNLPDWNTAFQTMDNSGLLLAENELLSCNLISTMNFSDTALTVLSACQTGNGIFHTGEGIYGLRRAFRLAGCHSMLVSLWQIDDFSGCYFMDCFYRRLTQNEDMEKAFHLAIKDLRTYEKNGIQPFSHPYYWAGYLFIR